MMPNVGTDQKVFGSRAASLAFKAPGRGDMIRAIGASLSNQNPAFPKFVFPSQANRSLVAAARLLAGND
jgi:hypothetical protein